MVSKFSIYTVHLKCFDSIRYNLNQNKTLTKNFNQTRTYVHTDTVKAICPHGDYRPRGHNYIYCKIYTCIIETPGHSSIFTISVHNHKHYDSWVRSTLRFWTNHGENITIHNSLQYNEQKISRILLTFIHSFPM